jgi:hypothetical protein
VRRPEQTPIWLAGKLGLPQGSPGWKAKQRRRTLRWEVGLVRDQPLLSTVEPWSAGKSGSGDRPRLFEARRLSGVSLARRQRLDHEEVKAQEGKVGCYRANYVIAMRLILTRTKALKTTKGLVPRLS